MIFKVTVTQLANCLEIFKWTVKVNELSRLAPRVRLRQRSRVRGVTILLVSELRFSRF